MDFSLNIVGYRLIEVNLHLDYFRVCLGPCKVWADPNYELPNSPHKSKGTRLVGGRYTSYTVRVINCPVGFAYGEEWKRAYHIQ